MLLILAVLVFGTPILWAVSVGAVRDARRAREQDPRVGCQAWVAVPGMRGRLYRCAEPVYAGGPWCRRHEVAPAAEPSDVDPDAEPVDEPQTVAQALVQARIGIPLAVLAVIATIATVAWAIVRFV